jgi:hypothetical protein
MRSAAALVVAVFALPPGALAGIYTCTDAEGRTVFRDAPCTKGERSAGRTTYEEPRSQSRTRPAADSGLDRKQVERLVARLDKAIAARDQKAVTALFGKHAVVEIEMGTGTAIDPMKKDAFARYLGGAFARPGYVYRPAPARISVSKSKPRATVTRAVHEALYVDGRLREIELRERLTVELDGRRVLISKWRKALPAESTVGVASR